MEDHRAPLGLDTVLKFEDKLKGVSRRLNSQREQVRAHMAQERERRRHSRPGFRLPTFAMLSPSSRSSASSGRRSRRATVAPASAEPSSNDDAAVANATQEGPGSPLAVVVDAVSEIDEPVQAPVQAPVQQQKEEQQPQEKEVEQVEDDEWTPRETRLQAKLAAHAAALDALQAAVDRLAQRAPPEERAEAFAPRAAAIRDCADEVAWALAADATALADVRADEAAWAQSFDAGLAQLRQYARDLTATTAWTARSTAALTQHTAACDAAVRERTLPRTLGRVLRALLGVRGVQRRTTALGVPHYVPRAARWCPVVERLVHHLLPWLCTPFRFF